MSDQQDPPLPPQEQSSVTANSRSVDELMAVDYSPTLSSRPMDAHSEVNLSGEYNLDALFKDDFSVGSAAADTNGTPFISTATDPQLSSTEPAISSISNPRTTTAAFVAPGQQSFNSNGHTTPPVANPSPFPQNQFSVALPTTASSAPSIVSTPQTPLLQQQQPQQSQPQKVQQTQPQQLQQQPLQQRPVVQTAGLTPQPAAIANGTGHVAVPPQPAQAEAGSLLDNILKQLPPEKQQQFRDLFGLLQGNTITPAEFMSRAQLTLDPAQFSMLNSIREKQPQRTATPSSPAAAGHPGSSTGATSRTQSPASPINSQPNSTIHTPQPQQSHPSSAPTSTPSTNSTLSTPAASQATTPQLASTQHLGGVALPGSGPSIQPGIIRKRTTDGITPTTGQPDAAKRVKMDHPTLPPSGLAVSTPGATTDMGPPSLQTPRPATMGISTPGPSPFANRNLALPGQRPPTAAVATPKSAGEKTNFDDVTDVMGYVEVDLKEEVDNYMKDTDPHARASGGDGQDRTKVQNFMNASVLKSMIERIAATHKLQTVDTDVIAYVALATQDRIRSFLEQMIVASKHRCRTVPTLDPPKWDADHPMYKVSISQDVKKQLLAIERVEREEETKRKEQIAERERKLLAGDDLDENGESKAKKRKQKEGGPGVSARNMSEEARKKVANQTAMGFAGGSGRSYSWMQGGSSLAAVSTPGTPTALQPFASGTLAMPGSVPMKPSLSRGSTLPAQSSPLGPSTPGRSVASPAAAAPTVPSAAASPSVQLSNIPGTSAAPNRPVPSRAGSMILPPSTLGRPAGLRDTNRKINVRDALFCLERDRGGGGGEGSGQRVLMKSYVKYHR